MTVEPEKPDQIVKKIPIWAAFGGRIKGSYGEVTLPSGAVVARISPPNGWWLLTRQEEKERTDDPTRFDFTAVFSYVNPDFMTDEHFHKEIVVSLVRGQRFRLIVPDPRRLALVGVGLAIHGVEIGPGEDQT